MLEDDKKILFEELGGRSMLEKINKLFYDKVYDDPWIGKYFKMIDQETIESQQVDFMTSVLGGGNIYLGKLPIPAHKHMVISEELFELRQSYLKEAFKEAGACAELVERWLKLDETFKPKIVKESEAECEKRFNTDEFLSFPKPIGYKKAA